MQAAVGWRTQSGALVQRVATRRLQVVADIPQFVSGVQPEVAALLLARATVEEALKAQDGSDPKRPQLMQRIIGAVGGEPHVGSPQATPGPSLWCSLQKDVRQPDSWQAGCQQTENVSAGQTPAAQLRGKNSFISMAVTCAHTGLEVLRQCGQQPSWCRQPHQEPGSEGGREGRGQCQDPDRARVAAACSPHTLCTGLHPSCLTLPASC